MTRELAARKGYWITYMGRPMADLVGSGLHINLSLTPVHGGPNAFDDPQAEYGLSILARQCIGGVIAHHEGMAAMSAPLINSYKRLIPGITAIPDHSQGRAGQVGSGGRHMGRRGHLCVGTRAVPAVLLAAVSGTELG